MNTDSAGTLTACSIPPRSVIVGPARRDYSRKQPDPVCGCASSLAQPSLNQYALNPNPSIRIIVKNGNVTLEGVVNDTGARDIANTHSNGVFGVFSDTNNLLKKTLCFSLTVSLGHFGRGFVV